MTYTPVQTEFFNNLNNLTMEAGNEFVTNVLRGYGEYVTESFTFTEESFDAFKRHCFDIICHYDEEWLNQIDFDEVMDEVICHHYNTIRGFEYDEEL